MYMNVFFCFYIYIYICVCINMYEKFSAHRSMTDARGDICGEGRLRSGGDQVLAPRA